MRNKADELNRLFNSNKWTCRDIDKILWGWRDSKVKEVRGVKDPKGYAAGYMSPIKRLKGFLMKNIVV